MKFAWIFPIAFVTSLCIAIYGKVTAQMVVDSEDIAGLVALSGFSTFGAIMSS